MTPRLRMALLGAASSLFCAALHAQAKSPACLADRKAVASLDAQLQTLLDGKDNPQNLGSAAFNYQQRINSLKTTLGQEALQEQKDCDPPPPPLTPADGDVFPSYMILTVVYAPPGVNGGMNASSVDYSSESSLGTSVSTANSFKNEFDLAATLSGGAFGDDASLTLDFSTSSEKTDKKQVDVKKTAKGDIKVLGPGTDGINHDEDRIYLWLNPRVHVAQDTKKQSWYLGLKGTTMDIQFVYVGWLKHPENLPPGLLSRFATAGITPADYSQMLQADPFSSGGNLLPDPARFIETSTTIAYEPPMAANDQPGMQTGTATSESKSTTSHTNESTVGFGVTVDAKTTIVAVSLALKVSDKFTWKHTNSIDQSRDDTEVAAYSIGQPAFGYAGSTDLQVYWDTVFQTFLFVPIANSKRLVTGRITAPDGSPMAHQEVRVTTDLARYRTFTDAQGRYRIPGSLTGKAVPATLKFADQTIPLTIGKDSIAKDIVAARTH